MKSKKIKKVTLPAIRKTRTVEKKSPVESKIRTSDVCDGIEDISYKVVEKTFPGSALTHSVFFKIPDVLIITKFTDPGTRVMVAGYPMSNKIYMVRYIDAGFPSYPRGGIQVYNATLDQKQSFYCESVAIHPTKKDTYKISEL
jgi:hypothetical protein